MLCKAIHKYGSQLTDKMWITLSRPEPHIEEEMAADVKMLVDLEPDEQCIRILRVLRSGSTPDKNSVCVLLRLHHRQSWAEPS
jgi:hypothetical protein